MESMINLCNAIQQVNVAVPPGIELGAIEDKFEQNELVIANPVVMAQILMVNLEGTMEIDPKVFTQEEKLYWAKVAFELGPDYLHKLSAIAAYMRKVEEF